MAIEILHLSDLHLSSNSLTDFSIVRTALIKRLEAEVRDRGAPDVVVFSGDIVQAGSALSEFELAKAEFIDPVLIAAQVSQDRFLIVPGNHDIDREVVRSEPELESGLKLNLADRAALNRFIDKSKSKSAFHFARLANYYDFISKNKFAPILAESPFFTTHTFLLKDIKIGFSCLNTAWRTTGEPDDVDYGQLLIGEHTIRGSLQSLQDCDVRVAVFHHPLKCLKSFDQSDCKSLLIKEFDLLMTGHCHEQRPELVITTSGRALISEAGALYVSREYFNGFCWIAISKREGTAEFQAWRYEDDNSRNTFEPATNIAAGGRFVVRLNTDEEIERFLGVEAACRALKPILEELANEQMLSHFTETAAPKMFAELYVPAHLKDTSQYARSTDGKVKEITEDQILASSAPYVIYGPRESGKTTFALRLCLRAIEECVRIPLYVDVAKIKAGTTYIDREIKRFAGAAFASFDYSADLNNGNLLIVFDNFAIPQLNPQSRQRKIEMVQDFIRSNPNNRYVLLADEAPSEASRVEKRRRLEIDHNAAFIQPLKRSGIRALTKKWLEPAGLHSSQNVKAVLEKIRAFNLPGTAQVVSMVLWTIERERSVGPVNEATLLQRFVEANLNRSDPAEVERGKIDFVIKEAFLSTLAQKMKESDQQYIAKNTVLSEAIDFFSARSWKYDASAFIEGLISNGTMVQTTNIDSQELSFRFRCLSEYFVAKYLQTSSDFLINLFKEDRYLQYVREIDILTGLTRDNASLLESALEKVQAFETQFRPEDRIPNFHSFKFSWAQALSDALALDVKSADATDAEIDIIVDEIDESITFPEMEESKTVSTRNPLSDYFESVLLLSKVARNNELVDNEKLKLQAIDKAIEAWCYFSMEGWIAFDLLSRGEGPEGVQERFNDLDDKSKSTLEFTLKGVLSAIVSLFAQDAMGTDKLLVLLAKAYDATDQALLLKRLLLIQVLLYLGFSAARCPPETITRAKGFIRDTRHDATLMLLTLWLFGAYMSPFLGIENRRLLEDLMADIVVARNAGKDLSSAQRNHAKTLLLPRLQKLRGNLGDDNADGGDEDLS